MLNHTEKSREWNNPSIQEFLVRILFGKKCINVFGITESLLAFKYEAICVLIVANLKTVPPFICLNNSVNGRIVLTCAKS